MRIVRSLLLPAALLAPSLLGAQSLLDRPPTLSGEWVGAPGTLYFHFIHRFETSDAPERKVSNVPTFLLGAGLPAHLFLGSNYSTNSALVARQPNEWEPFLRWAPLGEDYGSPLDLGAQVGYNSAADGVDAELSAARRLGLARLIVAGRTLADPVDHGHRRTALAGGGVVRLGTYVALAGDVAALTDRDSSERVAWSAGLHVAIPLTPHTISIHATNTLVNTLQGSSRGTKTVRYGFEFTIPLTLRRYFGAKEAPPPSPERAIEPAAPTDVRPSQPAAPDTMVAAPAQPVAPPAAPAPTVAPAPAPPRDTAAPRPGADTTRPRTTKPAAAPAPTRAAPARVTRTGMRNITYLQPTITVTAGTTVEWTNHDPLPHSVTAADRSFDSGLIQPGKTYRHTFTKPGRYDFYCVPHPFMKGVVIVRAP